MGRFRSSSLGSGAIILGFLLVLLHRYGTGLLFLVVGAGLLWYSRREREAREREAREREAGEPEQAEGAAPDGPEAGSERAAGEGDPAATGGESAGGKELGTERSGAGTSSGDDPRA